MVYVAWVIHLGPKRGSGMPGGACTLAEVALRGGVRRRAHVLAVLGSCVLAAGSVRVRGASACGGKGVEGVGTKLT